LCFFTQDEFNIRIRALSYQLTSDLTSSLEHIFKPLNKKVISGLNKITNSHSILKSKYSNLYSYPFDNKDQIFEAQNQLLKSIHYSEDLPYEDREKTLIFPVLVINGNILEAYFEKNELSIKKINHIRYLSNGIPEYTKTVILDIVALNFFNEYIQTIKEEVHQLIK